MAQKPSFTVNFPKWWKTEKFNITLTFSDTWKRMENSLFNIVKIGRYWISIYIVEQYKAKNRKDNETKQK